jgi:hypothetical protein
MKHSDMEFIEDNLFDIESYSKKFEDVRTVEFVRIIDNKYVFVEAKKSFAKSENTTDFNKNIKEITEKFIHSLYMLSSIELGINEKPSEMSNFTGNGIKFILVINADWAKNTKNLRGITKNIKRKVSEHSEQINKIFKPEVFVLDENLARKWKLVKSKTLEAV